MATKKMAKPVVPDAFQMLLQSVLKAEAVRELQFCPGRKWRFDYAIPSAKIAIEIEGAIWSRGRHVSPQGYIKDMEKYNMASVLGWTLLRFSTDQQFSKDTLTLIQQTYETKKGLQDGAPHIQ